MNINQATALLGEYDLEISRIFQFKDGISNKSFYVVDRYEENFVLTELLLHDRESASSIVKTLDHAHAGDIPVNRVIADPSGRKFVQGPQWLCLLTTFLAGTTLNRAKAKPVGKIAETLFAIHRLPAPTHLEAGGRRLPANWQEMMGSYACPDLKRAIEEVQAFAALFDGSRAPVMIHGDAFCDNLVLQKDGRLGVLDWEHASIDDPLLDLAIAASGLLATNGGDWAEVEKLAETYGEISGTRFERPSLSGAIRYALVVLAFQRFLRNVVMLPNSAKAQTYRAMLDILQAVPEG